MVSKIEILEYYEKLSIISPNTLYSWFFVDEINKEVKTSQHKTFKDLKWDIFCKKNIYRTEIVTSNRKELRLDFDELDLNVNIQNLRETIKILEKEGIKFYNSYLTGSKGCHLTFRYFTNRLGGIEELNKKLTSSLGLQKFKVDNSLFRAEQMILGEGYNNRKTLKPKLRIKFNNLDKDDYVILQPIDENYLKDNKVNILNDTTLKKIISGDDEQEIIKEVHKKMIWEISKPADPEKIERFLKRFIILWNETERINKTSGRRYAQMICKYLILSCREEEKILKYLESVKKELKINPNMIEIYNLCISDMIKRKEQNKPISIFSYKELLSKQEFFSKKF